MNMLQIASMVQSLGLNINFAALGSLLPLLNKEAVEIDDSDVKAVLRLLGLEEVNDNLLLESVEAIRTSEFDKISDLLGDQEFLAPLVQKFLYSQDRLVDRLLEDAPIVPVRCDSCGHVNNIERKVALLHKHDQMISVNCIECESTRKIQAGKVLTHGV